MEPTTRIRTIVRGLEYACIRVGSATTMSERTKWMKVRQNLRERLDVYLEQFSSGPMVGSSNAQSGRTPKKKTVQDGL